MKRRKNSFRHDSLQSQESIQVILKALTDGVAKGKITFSDEDDSITMKLEGLLNLRLTASQEDNRNRVNLRITWENSGRKAPKKKGSIRVLEEVNLRRRNQSWASVLKIS